jgi:hypothetical protein
MKVTIIETNESKTLNITDPKSGMDWTNDLLGNHGALPEYSDDTDSYRMSRDDYEWWSDLIDRYQAADDRYYELRQSLPGDEAEALQNAAQGINCDLEYYPAALQELCDESESLIA